MYVCFSLTSEVGGFINEGSHHQEGAVELAQAGCPLLGHQLQLWVLVLDAESPGGHLLLHLRPALLLFALCCHGGPVNQLHLHPHSPVQLHPHIHVDRMVNIGSLLLNTHNNLGRLAVWWIAVPSLREISVCHSVSQA